MRPDHDNAFDALRLILAGTVIYSHAYLLGGFGPESLSSLVRGQTIAGSAAVLGFFGVSGFLVTASFTARPDWRHFVRARLLRILPGFYFALVLSAFVFAPAIAALRDGAGAWHARDAAAFIFQNALVYVREWQVGEVLTGLPYPEAINGALWSLFPELVCYGLVLGLGLAGCLQNHRGNLVVVAALLLAVHTALLLAPRSTLVAPTLLALSGWTPFVLAFVVGAVVAVFRAEFGLGARPALVWWLVCGLLLTLGGWNLLGPIALPLALLHTAHSVRLRLPVDLSYGIYVYHFPLLQLAAAAGLNALGVGWFTAIATAGTVLFAALSWFLIERPALRLKARLPERQPQ